MGIGEFLEISRPRFVDIDLGFGVCSTKAVHAKSTLQRPNMLHSYHEATISCAVVGNPKMAALWAKKAAEIGICCLGNGPLYRSYDVSILQQLEAAADDKQFHFSQIQWPAMW